METNNARRHEVKAAELEVDDVLATYLEILSHERRQSVHVTILKGESILFKWGDSFTEEAVDDASGKDWLQVDFFVRLELLGAVQMDSKRGNLHKSLACSPVLALEDATFATHNNFASKRQVSIKPGSPKTTAVSHYIDLVVTERLFLASWSDLQNRTVSVAANNLEHVNALLFTLGAC